MLHQVLVVYLILFWWMVRNYVVFFMCCFPIKETRNCDRNPYSEYEDLILAIQYLFARYR